MSLIGIDLLLDRPEFRLAHLSDFLHHEVIALVLLLAVAVADRAVDIGRARRSAYVVTVILAVGLGTSLAYGVSPPWGRWLASTLYNAMSWLMCGGLATFVYVDRKRARATHARLAAAELERTRKAKQMLESRLQAMQGSAEMVEALAAPLERVKLAGAFRALPVKDANDGETVLCFRSYLPGAMRAV